MSAGGPPDTTGIGPLYSAGVAAGKKAVAAELGVEPDELVAKVRVLLGALEAIKRHPVVAPIHGRADLGIPSIPSCQEMARAAIDAFKAATPTEGGEAEREESIRRGRAGREYCPRPAPAPHTYLCGKGYTQMELFAIALIFLGGAALLVAYQVGRYSGLAEGENQSLGDFIDSFATAREQGEAQRERQGDEA